MTQELHLVRKLERREEFVQAIRIDRLFYGRRLGLENRFSSQPPHARQQTQQALQRCLFHGRFGDVEVPTRPKYALELSETRLHLRQVMQQSLACNTVEGAVFGRNRVDVADHEGAGRGKSQRLCFHFGDFEHLERVIDPEYVHASRRHRECDDPGAGPEIEATPTDSTAREAIEKGLEEIPVVDAVNRRDLVVVGGRSRFVERDVDLGKGLFGQGSVYSKASPFQVCAEASGETH